MHAVTKIGPHYVSVTIMMPDKCSPVVVAILSAHQLSRDMTELLKPLTYSKSIANAVLTEINSSAAVCRIQLNPTELQSKIYRCRSN